ncbi:MAG: ferrous iron transport protein A [Anaerolineae bacterium]|nr:ferrous iron transport protein A [Anaerolineae bacterium]
MPKEPCPQFEINCDHAALCHGDPEAARLRLGQAFPLCMARPGELVRVLTIGGKGRIRKRLADLGLTSGMMVRVVQSSRYAPLILALREDARLGVGRDLASEIWVERL